MAACVFRLRTPPRFMRWSRKRVLRTLKSYSPAPLRVVRLKWHPTEFIRTIGTLIRGFRLNALTTRRRDEAFLVGCFSLIDGKLRKLADGRSFAPRDALTAV